MVFFLYSAEIDETRTFKPFRSYVSFFGQLPRKLASEQARFLEVTEQTQLDASKANTCPDGIPVVVVASAKAPQRRITPRILITAKRRSWPVVSHAWMEACLQAGEVVPLSQYLVDYSELQLRVTTIKAVSSFPDHD